MEEWMTTGEAAKRSKRLVAKHHWWNLCRKFSKDETLCRRLPGSPGRGIWQISEKMFKFVMEKRMKPKTAGYSLTIYVSGDLADKLEDVATNENITIYKAALNILREKLQCEK